VAAEAELDVVPVGDEALLPFGIGEPLRVVEARLRVHLAVVVRQERRRHYRTA
jgi:hypothetical protein